MCAGAREANGSISCPRPARREESDSPPPVRLPEGIVKKPEAEPEHVLKVLQILENQKLQEDLFRLKEEKMRLSLRLRAAADMVTPGYVLADIGTDHAYIPIDLVKNGKIPRAIAMDINDGPLSRAQAHIREEGLDTAIETRRSDGLEKLSSAEAQSVLIAGMGGTLTIRILREGANILCAVQEVILQPQSDPAKVRMYLEQNGWGIVQENMVFEEGKFYPVMRAVHAEKTKPMNDLQRTFGPQLLAVRHPILHQFLLQERARLEHILDVLQEGKSEAALRRVREIENELRMTEEALLLYREV